MSKRVIRKRRHRNYHAASITFSIGGVEFTPKSFTYRRLEIPPKIINTCGKQLDCGGECFLWIGHPGECECKGDEPGQPGTCPA